MPAAVFPGALEALSSVRGVLVRGALTVFQIIVKKAMVIHRVVQIDLTVAFSFAVHELAPIILKLIIVENTLTMHRVIFPLADVSIPVVEVESTYAILLTCRVKLTLVVAKWRIRARQRNYRGHGQRYEFGNRFIRRQSFI